MGTVLLVCRLAARDIRRHAAQAVLLCVAIAAATATLTWARPERRDQPVAVRDDQGGDEGARTS